MTAGVQGQDAYDKVESLRREVLSKLNKWKLRRDLEMDDLKRENERLKEALAGESAISAKLRMELKTVRSELTAFQDPSLSITPTNRRKGGQSSTENGRPSGAAVSLWNNTDEEKEKVFAVLKSDGRAQT